jgi:putative ABC transport system permease protein
MEELLSRSLARRSFAAVLLVMFSLLGLILAALGIYGVVAYSVAQRTHEIGVRMALGAEPGSVSRMVLWQGLKLAALGLAIGAVAALGAGRWMSSLLYGIGAADPISLAAGCILLLAAAMLGCLLPALRATRVDPLVALRYE